MVTIIDRTGEFQEFQYDKRTYAFGKDKQGKQKTTQVLPLEVAAWLFSGDRHFVHTTEGFVRRYGVTDAPEDWVDEMGADVLETSALTRDTTRVEGWNVEEVDPLRARTHKTLDLSTTPHRPQRGDYVNQGAAAAAPVGS